MSSPEATKTPEELSKEAAERVRLAGLAAQKKVDEGAAKSMTQEDIEAAVAKILGAKRKEPAPEEKPPEPNWATITELQALDLRVKGIPVFEHEVPSYMDLQVADPEYAVVWANRDQRRLGQLLAEGYELLQKEHVAPSFQLPLKFDSEGLYIYQDVVAMRVHKRILYGKRRKIVERSHDQLKRLQDMAKSKLESVISHDPMLEKAFDAGSMGYYDAGVPVSDFED